MLLTYEASAAGQFPTRQVADVPKAPRQQNWSVLKTVQGLKQLPPLPQVARATVQGVAGTGIRGLQLGLEMLMPMGLSKPST